VVRWGAEGTEGAVGTWKGEVMGKGGEGRGGDGKVEGVWIRAKRGSRDYAMRELGRKERATCMPEAGAREGGHAAGA